MKKCVTSIFTVIAFLLLNVTNVSANSRNQLFTLSYVNGAPTSQTDMTLTLVPQSSCEIIINVSQLTEGAKLSVSSSNLNPKQTMIDKDGTYHFAILPMSTGSSVIVSIRLIPSEALPASSASGSIGYPN